MAIELYPMMVKFNGMKLHRSTALGHDPQLWLPPVNFYVELIWLDSFIRKDQIALVWSTEKTR